MKHCSSGQAAGASSGQGRGQARDGAKPQIPGQYFDRETRLHYTFIGRFISPDPIGLGGMRTMVNETFSQGRITANQKEDCLVNADRSDMKYLITPKSYNDIAQSIILGFRIPMNAQEVAKDIYLGYFFDKTISKDQMNGLIALFKEKLNSAEINIVKVTYFYMEDLLNSKGNLIYEEMLKLCHLYDYYNALEAIGFEDDSLNKVKLIELFRSRLLRERKLLSQAISDNLTTWNNSWWVM